MRGGDAVNSWADQRRAMFHLQETWWRREGWWGCAWPSTWTQRFGPWHYWFRQGQKGLIFLLTTLLFTLLQTLTGPLERMMPLSHHVLVPFWFILSSLRDLAFQSANPIMPLPSLMFALEVKSRLLSEACWHVPPWPCRITFCLEINTKQNKSRCLVTGERTDEFPLTLKFKDLDTLASCWDWSPLYF